jgi:hypothetical protein
MSPEQMNLFSQIFSSGGPGIKSSVEGLSQQAAGGDDYFKQLEAPALRQFQELQGNIASRFSGAGLGARKGSGFNNAQSGAAADLAERLQGQRQGLQQSAREQLLSLFQSLMGTSTSENLLVPKKKKWWEELGSSLAEGVGKVGGTAASAYVGEKILG